MGKSGPTHQSVLRSPRANNNPGGITAPPISKQAAQRPPGTQLPLISPRDKAPPTGGIRISSTYQWAGISPSHQEAYSKPPIPTSAIRGQTPEVREATTLLSVKKVTRPKTYKNEKTENYNSDEGERKNPRKTAKP